jgi:uncharacterized membrane protein
MELPSRSKLNCTEIAGERSARKAPALVSRAKERLMGDNNPAAATTTSGFAIHPLLAPFPLAFFLGAFVTDLIYWRAPDAMWETFSVWLITAGLIMAGLSVVVALIDVVGGQHRTPALAPAWPHALVTAVAFVLALINAFVHSRDGYTAVVPTGLILSGLVVAILLCAAVWTGREAAYRHRVGALN